MFTIYKWIKGLGLLLGLLILLGCIIWVEKKYAKQSCKTIDININHIKEQHFVEKKNILSYLSSNNMLTAITDKSLQQVQSIHIENIIKSHDFVQSCSVYKNWKGNLKIDILPKQVLARLIFPNQSGNYFGKTGKIVPLSTNYTARVLLIDGEKLCKIEKSIQELTQGKAILKILKLITKDPFLKAQITYIHLDNKDELILSTQFSKQKIYFGKPDNVESKMKKLKLFYKVILPYKGWNAYKQVNLKFDNQIVCE